MNTEKATTPSAKKTSTKEGKNTFDFSSLYASRDYEKDLERRNIEIYFFK